MPRKARRFDSETLRQHLLEASLNSVVKMSGPHLLESYHTLVDNVNTALFTQAGDEEQLNRHLADATTLSAALDQVS